MTQGADNTVLPLAGLTVVELGHSLSAPYATYILANLGCEIIKVEMPETGDYARGWGKVRSGDAAVMFHAINVGKKSIAANLRDRGDLDSVRRLILEQADVVVQNMKAGAVEKLGLDSATLRSQKPSLICCDVSAFGTSGPMRDTPGYDPIAQAASGMMSLIGHSGAETSRVPVSVNDMGAGMWSSIGILSALHAREKTGLGATIATSLYETAMSWMIVQLTDYLNSGEQPVRQGSGNANIVPYQVFRTRDGEILIAAGNDRLFRAFAEIVGLPAVADDPDYSTGSARVTNRESLIAQLSEAVLKMNTDQLAGELAARGVPAAPILDIATAAESEQTAALGLVAATPQDGVRTIGLPLSINGRRVPLAGKSPSLGEHNEILKRD
ncbi:CoA transferase [Vreelandella titanicae]|uniref:CaiB/BaiF CoA transferase family protein n=1 Tax=Vreelandella titanicae TaxID=664683 RepID=UPI003159D439